MRHPIERLVSAYRDRIAGLKASYAQYAAMARTLKLKRRDAVLEVRYKPRRGRKGAKEVVTRRPISVPTWPEFVKFILVLPTVKDVSSKHGNNIMYNQNICISNIYTPPVQDPHWAVYTRHCSPCLSNFTYIVHLEDR